MKPDDGLHIDRTALEHLAALLLERAGLKITPDGYYGLRLALLARLPKVGLSDATEYVRRLRQWSGEAELRNLLPLVTVGKTEFFRDTRQFLAFENEALPPVLEEARTESRKVHLWSAGCATGEEPYSLAMAAIERGASPQSLGVWATDLNPVAAESAARGFFPSRRLIGLSESRMQRFFHSVEGGYQVNDAVRAFITFEAHNLAAPFWPQVQPGSLDVIFCRNVIIYFDQYTIISLMERFFDSLRPGGWMFLGYSESLFKISTRFEMIEVGGTFAYRRPRQKRSAPAAGVLALVPPASPAVPRPAPAVSPVAAKQMTAQPPRPAPLPATPPVPEQRATPVQRLADVVRAIDTGDFPRALRLARLLVDEEPDDLAARLTLGNVYVLLGNLDEARESFGAALSREPLCVEARLFLAVAALQADQLEEAKTELTRALFLEPALTLGHYLLGQVHERRKDHEGARRAYRNAVKHRKAPGHDLLGHFPDLPRSNEAIAQSAQYRLSALSEA